MIRKWFVIFRWRNPSGGPNWWESLARRGRRGCGQWHGAPLAAQRTGAVCRQKLVMPVKVLEFKISVLEMRLSEVPGRCSRAVSMAAASKAYCTKAFTTTYTARMISTFQRNLKRHRTKASTEAYLLWLLSLSEACPWQAQGKHTCMLACLGFDHCWEQAEGRQTSVTEVCPPWFLPVLECWS